jgi:uncharacterized protein (DUF2062 family)/2-polyprenyl-3-methyl-5-hydroxy-6-metoxy-1,4-benzoquinol methylase
VIRPAHRDPRLDPAAAVPARRRPWLRRLYITLRTEHTTPVKVALAVGLGVFVGVSPLWGLHFALCVLLATAFRLNRILVYAAANIGNPLTAAPILFAELQIGHRVLQGSWLPIALADIQAAGLQGLVASLIVGSIVVGLALGAAIGAVSWLITSWGRHHDAYRDVADAIVLRYVDVSIRDAEAARAVLLRDPLYPFLLEEGFHLDGRRVLDLGCGRALAEALVGLYADPPGVRSYVGIDAAERYVRTARQVLEEFPGCHVVASDLRDFDPPGADVVIVNDVLRYLPFGAQDALLRRIARAVPPGARVFVREKNAGGGWRFRLAALADTLATWLPGRIHAGLHYRRAEDLRNALLAAGFTVRDRALARSTSPVWVLLEATRRPAAAR